MWWLHLFHIHILMMMMTALAILQLPHISLALSASHHHLSDSPSSSSTSSPFISSNPAIIRLGGICVLPDWISKDELQALRRGVQALREQGNFFQPSGLSNRVKGDPNEFGTSDRLTYTITTDDKKLLDYDARYPIDQRLEGLRQELEKQLNCEHLELAEQYYSISPASSFLPRHMDERHEDTKGEKGWNLETRRSISWLLYLNKDEWNEDENGGELRLFCRSTSTTNKCGANEGDIQVGWLPSSITNTKISANNDNNDLFDPIFLDSWVQTREENVWGARSALYRIQQSSTATTSSSSSSTIRDYLSDPFGPNSPSWPSHLSLEPHEFAAALRKQFAEESHQESFRGVEELEGGAHVVDVNPTGGSLVLFDSATVPHEVLKTKQGERLAMAGWFHEPIQDFPDWYGHMVVDAD
jgi:hypothetical protein